MSMTEKITARYQELQSQDASSALAQMRQQAFDAFQKQGIPGVRHEEWKYTRISSVWNHEFQLGLVPQALTAADLEAFKIPGYQDANELYFINGVFSPELSIIRSSELLIKPLAEAASGAEAELVHAHFGASARYMKDGINALSTALLDGGLFVEVKRGKVVSHPVYIYNVTDARQQNTLSQPRSLMRLGENAQLTAVETYVTVGGSESFCNQVVEIVVEQDARLEYYKLQNDAAHANLVSTTHIHQVAKSYVHTVTISLDGNIVRNNLNIIMDADHTEAHLYGLYFLHGKTHVDNHTLVDNRKPHCYSNEFYKGMMADQSTGIFNGKIYVQPDAQKINAYQSNKNILLSAEATVNTKPQLEIFADDVKCSHGCTVGQLDEDALFYLRSRGVSEKTAKALLIHGFALDVLEHILLEPVRSYVDKIISEKLEVDLHD